MAEEPFNPTLNPSAPTPPGLDIYMPTISERNSFTCNFKNEKGKLDTVEFFIETPHQQGIRRKVGFAKEAARLAFGTELSGMLKGLARLGGAIDSGSLSKAGFEYHSLVHRIGECEQERDPVLWLCTLFINVKEDARKHMPRDEERQWKIDVWSDAGIAYPFFKGLLSAFNDTLAKLLASSTPNSSESPVSPRPE